jgi:S1-C subfamily serine protease
MLVVAEVLDSCKVGDKVTVEVLRRGTQKKTLTVLLGERIPEITE